MRLNFIHHASVATTAIAILGLAGALTRSLIPSEWMLR